MNTNEKQQDILLRIIHQVCGMQAEKYLERLNNALDKRQKATKIRSVDNYIDVLQNDPNEVANFVSVLTINWTFFFRENEQIEYLLENIDGTKRLKIWSAACSTGAEPYSIAVQFLKNKFNFEVLATDISDIALEKAKKAVYKDEIVTKVPLDILHRYFQKGHGKQNGYVRVKDEVKKYVKIMKNNLLSDTQRIGRFDVIFCRNVLMYFDDNNREKVIQKLYRSLNHGGYFITGKAENIFGYNHQFKHIKKTPSIYRKLI